MPNALQIYGLQHFVHNLVSDVHTACAYWPTFFLQLKALSAILTVPERRRRFVAFCVKPSAFAREAHKFATFDAHLYTKRFKEVTNFSKKLWKILWVFVQTWDEHVYYSNSSREASADAGDDFVPLDTKEVSKVLKDHYFCRYVFLVVCVDSIPEDRIGKWGTSCKCHDAIRGSKSKYVMQKLMTAHYGNGFTVCPGAGCKASDLAAGYLQELFFMK